MGEHRVCPWWMGRLLASPLRRLWQDPAQIIDGHIHPGMIVLEPGPGMGFFTLELARRVGEDGKVVAVDQQPQMIAGLESRAQKAGLSRRIEARVCQGTSMGLEALGRRVDLTFAFAVVHEMPDARAFFTEAAAASKPDGRLLLAEPAGHVSDAVFATQLEAARAAGFEPAETLGIKGCRAALLGLRKARNAT